MYTIVACTYTQQQWSDYKQALTHISELICLSLNMIATIIIVLIEEEK